MGSNTYYLGDDMPMSFRYYKSGLYEGIESKCYLVNNIFLQRYVSFILSHRLIYEISGPDRIHDHFFK